MKFYIEKIGKINIFFFWEFLLVLLIYCKRKKLFYIYRIVLDEKKIGSS